MSKLEQYSAFTLRSEQYQREIFTKIHIFTPDNYEDPKSCEKLALWDTGASISCVSCGLSIQLGLKPINLIQINTANGPIKTEQYLINIGLPNRVLIKNVLVCKGNLEGQKYDALIGMDIINLGDMAYTHKNGGSVFTFQTPSSHDIDFVKEFNTLRENQGRNIGRNAPCPCGSGKKYKQCCGKSKTPEFY